MSTNIGYRVGGRHFDTLEEMQANIDSAISQFSSNMIVRLTQFVRTGGFPRDTGKMIESAVNHIRLSVIGTNFLLKVFFDTDYAQKVAESEKHFDFVGKRTPEFIELAKLELLFAFHQEGFEVQIS